MSSRIENLKPPRTITHCHPFVTRLASRATTREESDSVSMIALTRREFEHRGDVVSFEIRIVRQDFLARRASGKQVEYVLHADAETADARAATADIRTHRDS